MKGFGPEAFGEVMAETYDEVSTSNMQTETRDSVAFLAKLARGGSALELAIGTGRVALPLAAEGVTVKGIEASAKMAAKLHEKPGSDSIAVIIGDMADTRVAGSFDLVYLVFNTIFNLTSQDAQVRCVQNAARHLNPEGVFVVETVVPDLTRYGVQGQCVRGNWVTRDAARFEVAIHDLASQTVDFQRILITKEGTQLFPHAMRYVLAERTRPDGPARRPATARALGLVGPYALHFAEHEPRVGLWTRNVKCLAPWRHPPRYRLSSRSLRPAARGSKECTELGNLRRPLAGGRR